MTAVEQVEREDRSPFWPSVRTILVWAPITGYLALWWLLAGAPADDSGVLLAAPTQRRLGLAWILCAAAQAMLIAAEFRLRRRGRCVRDPEWGYYLFAVVAFVDAAVLGGFWLLTDTATGLDAMRD